MIRFLLCCALSFASLFGRDVDTLFILQDAGETQSLLPVIEQCGNNYAVLAGGVAEEQLSKSDAVKPHLVQYSELGIIGTVDKTLSRTQRFTSSDIEKIANGLKAKKVVTGVAFELHGQLLEEYAKRGSSTFAYWDNINQNGSDPYFATAKKVASLAKTLLVPTKAFEQIYPDAIVVGQPSLERWSEQIKAIDQTLVRAKFSFLSGKPILVYVGGYGAEYEEAFSLFCQALPSLTNYDVIVSFHPKMGGGFEQSKIEGFSNVHLLRGATTQEAVAIASKVVCHQSTAGVQAAAAGKDVYYLIPTTQLYTNPLIENGFTPLCRTADELTAALPKKTDQVGDFFTENGLPKNSAHRILAKLNDG